MPPSNVPPSTPEAGIAGHQGCTGASEPKAKRAYTVKRTNSMQCPTCQDICYIEKTEPIVAGVKNVTYQCQNEDCRWRGKGQISITHTLEASMLTQGQSNDGSEG